MLMGVLLYFAYTGIHALDSTHALAARIVAVIQPTLLFLMLFLSFCRISPHDLRLCPWHKWLFLIQAGIFGSFFAVLLCVPDLDVSVIIEGAMLCFICPTATAAAVVTTKLGGNAAHLVTYTILINLLVAVAIPLAAPLLHPQPGLTFVAAFSRLIAKVFPLLICPLLLAWLVRYAFPRLHALMLQAADLPFYLWTVSLMLAISVTTHSLVHAHESVPVILGLALASLLACVLQFYFGKRIGARYQDTISAGQALGQKNTVFLIWLCFTFFTPVTAIAGGFYCIWHNVINSYQLYHHSQP